jgi:hypothetical protein
MTDSTTGHPPAGEDAPDGAWSSSLTTSWRSAAVFVSALAAVNLLPFVPPLLTPLPASPYFPLSVDALVLVTGVVYTADTAWERPARLLATAGLLFLVAYQAYDAVVYTSFQRSGLFYEDVQYVVDLAYFALDQGVGPLIGGVLAGLAAAGLVVWATRRCLRALARTGREGGCRLVLALLHLLAWPVVGAVAPAFDWGTENLTYQTSNERTRVRTVTAKVTANAEASLRLHALLDSLGRAPRASHPYARYDSLRLERRPSVYLYMIESYGEVLARHPDLRGPYRHLLDRFGRSLEAGDWHVATALSDAPVRGGRSWLAIASVLLGTRVDHQLLYERVQARARADTATALPHMVRFFERQGYRTATLQPYTLERPGLPVIDTYGFDRSFYRDDLGYRGPPYGWGVVPMPDQYSLGVAHEQLVSAGGAPEADRPFFLFFETVFSHALWNYPLPPVLDDWRRFDDFETREAARSARRAEGPALLPDSLTARPKHEQPRPARFLRHIAYEVAVLRHYLRTKVPPNSLLVVMGDHQPSLLGADTFGVPVHVLSRDSSLVAPFRREGFTPGLRAGDDGPRLNHEGLYSLLVRSLTAAGTPADTAGLPSLRPDGAPRSFLMK